MHKYFGSLAAICLVFAGLGFASPSTAAAQDHANAMAPPNVLVIMREFLKPGMSGSPHEKTESAFVQAMKEAKATSHYIAVDSLSGPSRALFLLGYDSFADWGKDLKMLSSNSTLAQQFDQAQQADGKLLTSYDSGVFTFQPDKSVNPNINVGKAHFWEITRIRIKLGHDDDWDALAKMHNDVYRNMPGAQWAVFDKVFGTDSGETVLVFSAFTSLAELDAHRKAAHHAWSQVSSDRKKKMDDLEASTFDSIDSNLFATNPKMSYIADSWRTADPEFWGRQ